MLYNRIVFDGTINEENGKPNPVFALPATVNWMRALAIICEKGICTEYEFDSVYQKIQRKPINKIIENTIFEQLFLSLHHLSALEKMRQKEDNADFARIAIVGGYYGISNAASAMIAAQCGSFQENHEGTAKQWDEKIAASNLAITPFDFRITSLIEKDFGLEIKALLNGAAGDLKTKPVNEMQARAAALSYLSGTARWYAWKVSEDVKRSSAFRALNVSDFRTKTAQNLRNTQLKSKSIGFLHQCIRYRGKANYREALFLAYGKSTAHIIDGLVDDIFIVNRQFLRMAFCFCKRKIEKSVWTEFVKDVSDNRSFSLEFKDLWK